MNRSCLNDGARITAGSYGNGRIDSSPGRVAPSGAPILSIHNFKVFWAVEERSLRPHGANPAASVSSLFQIRVPSLESAIRRSARQDVILPADLYATGARSAAMHVRGGAGDALRTPSTKSHRLIVIGEW